MCRHCVNIKTEDEFTVKEDWVGQAGRGAAGQLPHLRGHRAAQGREALPENQTEEALHRARARIMVQLVNIPSSD